jgi:hypothetical protein
VSRPFPGVKTAVAPIEGHGAAQKGKIGLLRIMTAMSAQKNNGRRQYSTDSLISLAFVLIVRPPGFMLRLLSAGSTQADPESVTRRETSEY